MADQQERVQSTPKERQDAAEQLAAVRQDWTTHFGVAEISDPEVYELKSADGKAAKGATNAVLVLAVNDVTQHAEAVLEWLNSLRKKGLALSLTILVRNMSLPAGLKYNPETKEWHSLRVGLEKTCGIVDGPKNEVRQFNVLTSRPCGVSGEMLSPAYWQGVGFTQGLNSPVPLERNAGQIHTLTLSDFGPASRDDLDLILSSFLSGLSLARPEIAEACDSARQTEVTPDNSSEVDFSDFFV